MKNLALSESFDRQLEAVFAECEQSISVAIAQYEKDIYGALELVKRDCMKRTRLSS